MAVLRYLQQRKHLHFDFLYSTGEFLLLFVSSGLSLSLSLIDHQVFLSSEVSSREVHEIVGENLEILSLFI